MITVAPKVISFVGKSAEEVREAACARGVSVGVEYALTGRAGAYTLTKSVAMGHVVAAHTRVVQ